MDPSYVVVVLEVGSDDPGVEYVYGPFTHDEAEDYASELCSHMEWTRGVEVQISMLRPDPKAPA